MLRHPFYRTRVFLAFGRVVEDTPSAEPRRCFWSDARTEAVTCGTNWSAVRLSDTIAGYNRAVFV
jgi:hypothetical protein